MDINRLTQKYQEEIAAAQSLASERNHQQIDVAHLLFDLLQQDGGLVPKVLGRLEVPVLELSHWLESHLAKVPSVKGVGVELYISDRLNKVLEKALRQSEELKDQYSAVRGDDSSRVMASRETTFSRFCRPFEAVSW